MTTNKKEASNPKIIADDNKKTEPEVTSEPVTKVEDAPITPVVMDKADIYESHKKVLKFPMTLLEYNVYRGWELPEDANGADEGYLVEYLDGGEPNVEGHVGYVSWSPKEQFDNGYNKLEKTDKSLGNTDINAAAKNVADLEVFGDGDLFKLISKASSKSENWMKSTKAMFTGTGCVVQVTTQQGDNIAEAVTYVPGVRIREVSNRQGIVTGRTLVKMQ